MVVGAGSAGAGLQSSSPSKGEEEESDPPLPSGFTYADDEEEDAEQYNGGWYGGYKTNGWQTMQQNEESDEEDAEIDGSIIADNGYSLNGNGYAPEVNKWTTRP